MAQTDNGNVWLPLSDGRFVSAGRLQKTYNFDEPFDNPYTDFMLQDAAQMPGKKFGIHPEEYGIVISESDPPIDKFIKATIVLRRDDEKIKSEHDKGIIPQKDFPERYWRDEKTFVPTRVQYVDMLLDVAAAKARGEEPLASFYNTLTRGTPRDVLRDVLRFEEKIATGANKGKYMAVLLSFNEDGILSPMEEIIVPGEGYARAIDKKTCYPIETSREFCRIENIEKAGLEGIEIAGKFSLGEYDINCGEPTPGEERLVTHVPWDGILGLLNTRITKKRSDTRDLGYIGALRLKDMRI